MVEEIKQLRDGGATGVVIGALTPQDGIDYDAVEAMVAAAQDLHITFHRAIDHLALPEAVAAVPRLADLGVRRILSSGGAARAGEGVAQLSAMHESAAGRLSIMAGGGVQIADFGAFRTAGLNDVHLSAKLTINQPTPPPLTASAGMEDNSYYATSADLVRRAAESVRSMA